MKVFGVTGWKNAGKTGLMERLVADITARGYSVSTIKHAHHSFDVDHPGKDSHRHRLAGAREVILSSRKRVAQMTELGSGQEPELADLLSRLTPVDLVLVEGYKRAGHDKIEAFRQETQNPLIALQDSTICAVASDTPLTLDRPVFDLDDTAAIADFVLQHCGLVKPAPLHADSSRGAPTLKNDCFALPPGVHWTPVDEALERLQARLVPVVGTEPCETESACGKVLAQDVRAAHAHPPHSNSAVDGYGFAAASVVDGANKMPLTEMRAAAGPASTEEVPFGSAVRILTGAALPAGVDSVVLQEDCAVEQGAVVFNGPVRTGSNTRLMGEDIAARDIVLRAGRRVQPADLGVLASAGVTQVEVYAPLRVGVLSTGDELVSPGQMPRTGQIPDANRPMLLSMLRKMGHESVDLGQVRDTRDALRDRLNAADVDAILTSGGASAGDEDHVSALLGSEGQVHHWRIALKPGRPLVLGMWKGTPVFGLPGNPVAAFTCTLVFAAPALSLLSGAGWQTPMAYSVPAAFGKRKKPGRREYLRARIRDGAAEVFGSEGSGRVSGISWAEGFVMLTEEAQTITPGDPVTFIPFSSFGI